jgi:hypothetical protein
MSPRLQNQIAKSKEQALAAFVSKKAEIDAMLMVLERLERPLPMDWREQGAFLS